jgi:hypothetical protein
MRKSRTAAPGSDPALTLDQIRFLDQIAITHRSSPSVLQQFEAKIQEILTIREFLVATHRTCSSFMPCYLQHCNYVALMQILTAMQDHFVDFTMHKTGSRTTRYLMDRMVEFINGQPIERIASSVIRKLKRNMDIIGNNR